MHFEVPYVPLSNSIPLSPALDVRAYQITILFKISPNSISVTKYTIEFCMALIFICTFVACSYNLFIFVAV